MTTMEIAKKPEQTIKHNFDLIPDYYRYQISNNNLIIYQTENFTYINIDLIETISENRNTVDIIIISDNIYISYQLFKDFPLIHCSVINLTK